MVLVGVVGVVSSIANFCVTRIGYEVCWFVRLFLALIASPNGRGMIRVVVMV